MKSCWLVCWMLALAASVGQGQSTEFLRVRNSRIANGQGEIILRGMGLGGWMLQEGYMLGLRNDGTQHSIKARITGLIGESECARFYQLWLQNFISRADIDLLARSGFNSIR